VWDWFLSEGRRYRALREDGFDPAQSSHRPDRSEAQKAAAASASARYWERKKQLDAGREAIAVIRRQIAAEETAAELAQMMADWVDEGRSLGLDYDE
jgi:hypothetical protein